MSSQVTVAPSVGGTISSISPVCTGTNRTPLTLISQKGVVLRWESSTDNFATTVTPITSSLTTYYVDNLTATTYYRAVLQNENCITANSAIMSIIVNPLPTISGTLTTTVGASTALTGSGTAAAAMPWVSATMGVATVSNTGVVTGVSVGTSVLTYTDNNGCAKTATVTINSATLPVELIDFKVTPFSIKVLVEWSTASEKESHHFDIERSENGKTFYKIGNLKAQNTSISRKDYAFMDEKPHFGTHYYRLKMVNTDSTFMYSPIKTAAIQADKALVKLSPNPTSDETYLTILSPNEAAAKIKLYNTNGQIVKILLAKLSVGENTVFIDMTHLSSGLYFIQLEVGGTPFSMKINKN
jgi:Secretion system C-terminal sorting domain